MYFLLATVYVVVALVSGLVSYYLDPFDFYAVFPAISIFYWVTGILLNYALDRCRYQPNKLLSVFMVGRTVKFVLTIIFLAVGVHVLSVEKVPFAITLMCNYFLYTGLEVYLYYRYSTWHSKRLNSRNAKK
jgi:F0F1-type ATP synthase assembly protein I